MPFNDNDLARLKNRVENHYEGSLLSENPGEMKALLARLEATTQCAYDLEGICEVECPDCGKELDDPHEPLCDVGKNLEAWLKASGR